MAESWVSVAYDDDHEDAGEDPIEVQTEPDGTLLLSSIIQQFPGVTGLKFRKPNSKGFRMVRVVPNEHTSVLYPPSADDGWGETTYLCVKPKTVVAPAPTPAAAAPAVDSKIELKVIFDCCVCFFLFLSLSFYYAYI